MVLVEFQKTGGNVLPSLTDVITCGNSSSKHCSDHLMQRNDLLILTMLPPLLILLAQPQNSTVFSITHFSSTSSFDIYYNEGMLFVEPSSLLDTREDYFVNMNVFPPRLC